MADQAIYRILIGGGGTGGHVFPAIAIADALKHRYPEAEFLFVGARGKLEMEKVPEAGYAIRGLPVAGFQRRITLKNISFFFKLAASMLISRRIIRSFRPHLAIGVGGYASGPILKAASRRGIPSLLQEQNSYAGVTNRLLARSASTICVAYENMDRYFPAERIVITGNPIRKNLLDLPSAGPEDYRAFGLSEGRKTFLVVGGSLGARTLNQSLLSGMAKLNREDVQVIWQCGRIYHEEVRTRVEDSQQDNLKVMPFISDMGRAYALADVIVSRAGAISISELCVVGKAVILVPSPNVAENHQFRNAEALEKRGAAEVVLDADAPSKLVDAMLQLSANEERIGELSGNIKEMALPDASERIAEEAAKILSRT